MKQIIVSRHPAAIEFIKIAANLDENVQIITGNATIDDVRDRVVFGNLPLNLARYADAVFAVEFLGDAPRGQEYSLQDMCAAGAYLRGYKIKPLNSWHMTVCPNCGLRQLTEKLPAVCAVCSQPKPHTPYVTSGEKAWHHIGRADS